MSSITKRSIVLAGLKTSVSLEDVFWTELKEIAQREGVPLVDILNFVNGQRGDANFSSAVRIFVLCSVRDRIAKGNDQAPAIRTQQYSGRSQ